ncbi:MAG: radical SAM protein, partial [Lachnospiraceae bacterium]|nr:radical SAM protein [Lachnospiraceae bacterium]
SWIRLLYCYPEEIDEALIEVIRDEKKICHYIDMPIQHASDDILRRMGRKTTRSDLENLIRKLRRKIPDICIRTTLITGFPGETEADHEMVLDFVERMRFDRLGVFTYSREEGTAAFDFDGQVDEETAAKRRDEIMQLQQGISRGKGQEMIGRRLQAFVEGRMVDEDALVARTYRDAPDVDGYVFLQTEREFMSGTLVDVVITGANEYDLTGECLDESPQ